MNRNNLVWAVFGVVLFLELTGCAEPQKPESAVDARFRPLYDSEGGEAVLGKALAPMFVDGGRQMQFTDNALLIYDEQLPVGERYNFVPIGTVLGQKDVSLPELEQTGLRYLNGHIIFAEFVPLFDQLGGVRFVGNPLTEVRLNTEFNRYEQYFEKLGFYRNLAEAENMVHLLPYGLIACRQYYPAMACEGALQDAIPDSTSLPQPFVSTIARLGEDFAGAPLSPPSRAADGLLEQIYENIVLTMAPNGLRTITLRNLPARVGLNAEPLVGQVQDPLMVFVQLDPGNNLGHNVPKAFLEYIASHGGNDLSGPPISELRDVNGIWRQCFTNYCLDYDPHSPQGVNIHPAPLGYEYQRLQGFLPTDFNLMVWESKPIIAPGETQVIGVMVYNATPQQPVTNLQPTLKVFAPGKEMQTFQFPPTSASGSAYVEVSLPEIGTGMIISYEVCALQPGSATVCVKESWLVK